MPYTIRFEDGIFHVKYFGTLTNVDLVAAAREAATLESSFGVTPNRIADLGQVEKLDITFEDLRTFAFARLNSTTPHAIKSAVIASDPVHFGFARMYQSLLAHSQIHTAIFPTYAEGLQWLSLPGLDAPEKPWSPPQPTPPVK